VAQGKQKENEEAIVKQQLTICPYFGRLIAFWCVTW